MTRTALTFIGSLLIFWCWNLPFLFSGLMFLPDLVRFDVSWDFWLGYLSLLALPAVSVFYGVRNLSRPGHLLRWFYAFEAPLQLLLMVRIFLIRELTPPLTAALVVLVGGLLLQLRALRAAPTSAADAAPAPAPAPTSPLIGALDAAASGWILLVGLWAGILTALVAIPSGPPVIELLLNLVEAFFSFDWLRLDRGMGLFFFYVPMVVVSLAWTSTLFVTLPFAFTALALQHGLALRRRAEASVGPWASWALCALPILLLPLALQPGAPQPQAGVLQQIREAEAADLSPELRRERRAALIADQDRVRAGLVNAALARYRYWGSADGSDAVGRYWEDSFSLDRGHGDWAQATFNALCSPLIYQGDWNNDPDEARAAYERVFDVPFQEAEREAMRAAINATWERSEAEAGLLDIGDEKVLLIEQSLRAEVSGPVATVVLDEVYQNQTDDTEEIQISFSLPESAAVTGLWLSDDPADPTKYAPVLAPRGAAQQVYNEARSRRTDPAILEQVGPRQYRLRVFPIPAAPNTRRDEPITANHPVPKVYLRMQWSALLDAQGVPLPIELERRNLFWDSSTLRTVNGQPLPSDATDAWMPARFGPAASASAPLTATLPTAYQITATPTPDIPATPSLPPGLRLRVGIDGSLSMAAHRDQLARELDRLRALVPADQLDLLLLSADAATPLPDGYQPAEADFFGPLHAAQALTLLAPPAPPAPAPQTSLDLPANPLLLYLTDDGAYKGAMDAPLPADLPRFFIVHLGGHLPIGYPDAVADRLYTDGGIGTSIPEILYAATAPAGTSAQIDGWTWTVTPADPPSPTSPSTPPSDPFAPLAARRVAAHLARQPVAPTPARLDQIHAVAAQASAVTPWTTLLVLVEDWQRERLKQLSEKEDRFDREVEDGQEFVTNPGSPLVSSVPEPEEYLLFLLAGGMLIAWRRGRAPHPFLGR